MWDFYFSLCSRGYFFIGQLTTALFHKYLLQTSSFVVNNVPPNLCRYLLSLPDTPSFILHHNHRGNRHKLRYRSKYTAFVLYLLIYPSSGRAGKFNIVFLFVLFNLSECQQKRGSYIKIQRKAQSKLYASNFPMWVGKFANSHLCEALFERP